MKIFLLTFLSVFLFNSSSYCREVLGIDTAYPPYMYGDKGQAKGLYVQLLKKVFQKMNVDIKLEAKPWARVMRTAKRGKWGVGGIYKNAERVKIFDYSEPIYKERLLLFVRKSSTIKFNSLKDLKGKTLAIMRGWSYGTEFDNAKKKGLFRVVETNRGEQSFNLLFKKRVNGVVMDSVSAKVILEKNKWTQKVKEKTTPVATNAAYIVFLKSMKKVKVINHFNKVLSEIKKDGTYNKIISSFIKN